MKNEKRKEVKRIESLIINNFLQMISEPKQ